MMKLLSLRNLNDQKHELIEFTGRWRELMGTPEKTGCWITLGKSGMGKTAFMMQLARELDEMKYRVMILSLEEGSSLSFTEALRNNGITAGVHKITVSTGASVEELDEYLINKKSRRPDMIIIDSIQYWSNQYKATASKIIDLRNKYAGIVFICTSHVIGNEVEGSDAYSIKRDSFCRIYIEGFMAFYRGRGSGGPTGQYVIWKEGADKYWLKNEKKETV